MKAELWMWTTRLNCLQVNPSRDRSVSGKHSDRDGEFSSWKVQRNWHNSSFIASTCSWKFPVMHVCTSDKSCFISVVPVPLNPAFCHSTNIISQNHLWELRQALHWDGLRICCYNISVLLLTPEEPQLSREMQWKLPFFFTPSLRSSVCLFIILLSMLGWKVHSCWKNDVTYFR